MKKWKNILTVSVSLLFMVTSFLGSKILFEKEDGFEYKKNDTNSTLETNYKASKREANVYSSSEHNLDGEVLENVDLEVADLFYYFYGVGVYTKNTNIYVNPLAIDEIEEYFHAGVSDLERITYYNFDELWMTNESGTINSGYGTSEKGMTHFTKVDGQNVVDYTVLGTSMEEFYITLKDFYASPVSGWEQEGNRYINSNPTVIDMYRNFTAPLWIGKDKSNEKYIDFTYVSLEQEDNCLVMKLWCSATNEGLLQDGVETDQDIRGEQNSNLVFSKAIISTDIYRGTDFNISINGENAIITKYVGNSNDIKVPSRIEKEGKTYKVTGIGSQAFYECSNLTSIIIPEGITSIEQQAFSWCSSLTSIVIPNSVTSIGKYAFIWCTNLRSVVLPNSINIIETGVFRYCSSLTSIEIPDSVTSIESFAFYECSSLTSIEIPSNVTRIENYALLGCSSLISVTFGEESQLTKIGASVFEDCSSLTSIEIPDSVTIISSGAFYHCKSLISVTFEEESQLTTIASDAFRGCSSLTNIEIPNSVTSIGNYVFSGCSNLTIYCEASSKSSGWYSDWNSSDRPVYWLGEWEYDENGNPVPLN